MSARLMHNRLPVTIIFFFALASLFTLSRFAFAYQESQNTQPQQIATKKIARAVSPKISKKPSPTQSQTTPTPTSTIVRPVGGFSLSPSPTTPISPTILSTPAPTSQPTLTPQPTANTQPPTADTTSYLIGEVNKHVPK